MATAEPIMSDAAAAEPAVEQPAVTASAAGTARDATDEQTAVLPVVAGGLAAAPAEAADGTAAGPSAASNAKDEPVKIGFKTFQTAEAALKYYYDLIKCLRREQDINEYEHTMVLDLLQRGHPAAAQKIGCGVNAIQIMRHSEAEVEADCFYVVRIDGSREDFSVRKSVAGLFPIWAKAVEGRPHPTPHRGRGRGGRGGGRDAGRGPGRGRGRGGRGFRARGAGGRRGRGRGRA